MKIGLVLGLSAASIFDGWQDEGEGVGGIIAFVFRAQTETSATNQSDLFGELLQRTIHSGRLN